MNLLGTSKQTTFGGIILGLPIILRQLANLLDNDPSTIFDFAMVISALGAMYALYMARDNKRTSEQVGAGK